MLVTTAYFSEKGDVDDQCLYCSSEFKVEQVLHNQKMKIAIKGASLQLQHPSLPGITNSNDFIRTYFCSHSHESLTLYCSKINRTMRTMPVAKESERLGCLNF